MSAEKEIIAFALSDTHGHLPDGALQMLHGADSIFHAGDIGSPAILDQLRKIAPVHAVRGNMDRHSWAGRLSSVEVLELGGHTVCLLHDLAAADVDFRAMKAALVLHGHTHRPSISSREGILFVNPGSISQPRSDAGPTLARIHIGRDIRAEIIEMVLPE